MFCCRQVGSMFENQNDQPPATNTKVQDGSLDLPLRKRYEEKLSVIGAIDPYVTESERFDCSMETFYCSYFYPDVADYLIFGNRPFTVKPIKSIQKP